VIHFSKIFLQEQLDECIAGGYVRVVQHPTAPLRLYSYTEKAAYERVWNACTMACRGLILDHDGNVVARPFSKFFNVDEPDAAKFDADDMVEVDNKFDGSLIIAYPLDFERGEWAFATRGSFTSPQARHAMKHLPSVVKLLQHKDTTYLFEGIWPTNRIVLDYGEFDGLVFLAAIDNASGKTLHSSEVADRIEFITYAKALALPPRPNAEGYVIRKVETDERIKLKQDDYCALHRIITQCTARMLWEHLAVNDLAPDHGVNAAKLLGLSEERYLEIIAADFNWLDALIRPGMPPAFAAWAKRRSFEMSADVAILACSIEDDYLATVQSMPKAERKELAAKWANHPHRGALFARLDHKPIRPYCWKAVYPGHELPFANNE